MALNRLNEIVPFEELPEDILVAHQMWTGASYVRTLQISSHCLEGVDRDLEECALLTRADCLHVSHPCDLFKIPCEQDLLIERITGSHLMSEDFSIEVHLAPTIKDNIHGAINLLSILVQRLVGITEQNATILEQVMHGGLLETEQNRMVCLNLVDTLLSFSYVTLSDKLRVQVSELLEFVLVLLRLGSLNLHIEEHQV